MPKATKVTISVLPNEILFPDSEIVIEAETPLHAEFVQSAVRISGQVGYIRLSHEDRRACWQAAASLPTGHHMLIVGELISKAGEKLSSSSEIPFFVTDSKASVPANLHVESIVRLRVGKSGIERLAAHHRPPSEFIELMKASDRKSGEPTDLAFDQDGRSIDVHAIFADIAKKRLERFGKLHESLHEKLERLGGESRIDVAIWLQSRRLPMKTQERLKRLEGRPTTPPLEVIEHRKQLAEETNRFLEQLKGISVGHNLRTDPLAPVVYAELNPTEIRRIEKLPDVQAIFLHETGGIDDLSDSIAIANSDDVHTLGYKGAGVKVAVWEDGPDKTDDLVIAAFYDTAQTNTSQHARHTHGIIKNKEKNKPKGHAPSCTLHSANDRSLDALKWAVKDEGCTVISQSFHRSSEPGSSSLSYDDIYKDWLVLHWPYPTILQAAGNYWSGDPDNINPPSDEYVNHKGYNSLAVGNHNDNASALAGDSVFRNPASQHGDRELPEVCANGTGVTTVGLTMSGTSMAAPAAAGCTALIQNVSSTLTSWPEGCRAILLAGASRNVQGNTWWQDIVGNSDAGDGTGSVDAYESVMITQSRRSRNAAATRRGWDIGTLRSSDFGSDRNSTFVYKVQVPSGWFGPRHVKVALAWDSQVSTLDFPFVGEIPLTSQLAVDLDLKVYDSTGNQVGYAGSYDNSYEIAEFDGQPGQTYTVRIRRWSGTDDTWYGIAWTVSGGIQLGLQLVSRGLLLDTILQRTSPRRQAGLTIRLG